MSFVPENELKERSGLTFAPMIDFLFLMLAFFASLAVTNVSIGQTDINLVQTKAEHSPGPSCRGDGTKVIHISILGNGEYKWVTGLKEYPMKTPTEIACELSKQHQKGLLPEDKMQTKVLLRIDKEAKWEPILNAMVAIRECGFEVHPVFQETKKRG
jgi:biopolymer transport protein ExbD